MQSNSKQYLVFTDLDGSLLDHHTYDLSPVLPVLEELKAFNIPVIFNSSKTFAEQIKWCKDLSLMHPFIVENGGGIFWPKGYFEAFASGLTEALSFDIDDYLAEDIGLFRERWLSQFHDIVARGHYQLASYSLNDPRWLMETTGLSVEQAKESAQRHYTEPMIWQDTEARFRDLKQQLSDINLQVVKGGRFHHVMGQGQSKGLAIERVKNIFETQLGKEVVTIGLGDGDNDIAMLNIVDYPVVIRKHSGDYIDAERLDTKESVYWTEAIGPEGWAEAVRCILGSNGFQF